MREYHSAVVCTAAPRDVGIAASRRAPPMSTFSMHVSKSEPFATVASKAYRFTTTRSARVARREGEGNARFAAMCDTAGSIEHYQSRGMAASDRPRAVRRGVAQGARSPRPCAPIGAMPCSAMSASCFGLPRTPSRPPWICERKTREGASLWRHACAPPRRNPSGLATRLWVQRLHAAVLDLREARVVRHVLDREASVAQRGRGAARRQQLRAGGRAGSSGARPVAAKERVPNSDARHGRAIVGITT